MLWKNRCFRQMFLAHGISSFGDWFDFIALAILLGFVWQADPRTIALMPIAFAVPGMLLSQLAGVLADRWPKRQVMIVTDLVRAALTVLLLFAPNAYAVLGLILLRSTAKVFHFPAQQALTRQVVPVEQLFQATTMNGTVFQLAKVIGPMLGGSLAATTSPYFCIAVNAASYIGSALLLLFVRHKEAPAISGAAAVKETRAFNAAWKEGWRVVMTNRLLLVSILFSLAGTMAIQLIDAQLSVLFREVSPDNPELIGWTVTAVGCGALVTVAIMYRMNKQHGYAWLLGGGLFLIGAMFAWLGLYRTELGLFWPLIGSFFGGIGTGFSSIAGNYLLQKESPGEAVGRVSGIYESLSSLMFIVAPLLGGMLIHTFGAALTFQWVGVLIGGLGLVGMLFQRAFRERRSPANDVRA